MTGYANRIADLARLTIRAGERGDVRLEPAVGGVERGLGRLVAAVALADIEGTWRRFKACPWAPRGG